MSTQTATFVTMRTRTQVKEFVTTDEDPIDLYESLERLVAQGHISTYTILSAPTHVMAGDPE